MKTAIQILFSAAEHLLMLAYTVAFLVASLFRWLYRKARALVFEGTTRC